MGGRPRALHSHITRQSTGEVLPVGQARCQAGNVPLARAGLMAWQRPTLDGNRVRNPHDGRMVDALALAAEEGRGHAAKCPGEALAACDPGISEWGNPPGARPGT